MTSWQTAYLDRFYSPAQGFRNGTAEFHELCATVIPHGTEILEIGSGPSNRTSRFLSTIGPVHGIDPDPDVKNNDALTSASVLTEDRYPYPDGRFGACVSNYCCEHVGDPAAHLSEIARVLAPGGVYILRTPNRWHYVSLFSAMTPHWVHNLLANRLRNIRNGHDPYPTVYAMNTREDLTRYAEQSGLVVEQFRLVEKEPSYGMSSRLLFLTFMAYERAVNSSEMAAFLRSNIFAVLRKPR
ncbi:MAG: class I SAM-dependent methyltransferase [Minicystis sp.]